jgi:hypothetical protein
MFELGSSTLTPFTRAARSQNRSWQLLESVKMTEMGVGHGELGAKSQHLCIIEWGWEHIIPIEPNNKLQERQHRHSSWASHPLRHQMPLFI